MNFWNTIKKVVSRNCFTSYEVASGLQAEPECQSVKTVWHMKCARGPVMTSEKEFEIEFFIMLLSTALISVIERIKQLYQNTET
jgi:hypothetical protein